MKERAIVIFELGEKEERKKGLRGLTGATVSGGGYALPFSISDNVIISNEKQ